MMRRCQRVSTPRFRLSKNIVDEVDHTEAGTLWRTGWRDDSWRSSHYLVHTGQLPAGTVIPWTRSLVVFMGRRSCAPACTHFALRRIATFDTAPAVDARTGIHSLCGGMCNCNNGKNMKIGFIGL